MCVESEFFIRDSCGIDWHEPVPNLNTTTTFCYKFKSFSSNWYQANKGCESENSSILEIQSVEELQWIQNLTINNLLNNETKLWWLDTHSQIYGHKYSAIPSWQDGRFINNTLLDLFLTPFVNPSFSYWTCSGTLNASLWDYYMQPACYSIYPLPSIVYLYSINCFQKGSVLGAICRKEKNHTNITKVNEFPFSKGNCTSDEIESDYEVNTNCSCYRVFVPENGKTWNDAYRTCKHLGYYLLEI